MSSIPPVSVRDLLFGVGLLASVVLCGLAYVSYRRWDEPGVEPFVAFTALLGLGGVAGGVGHYLITRPGEMPVWAEIAFPALFLWAVPWALFGLQYTGRYTRIRWRTVGLFLTPVAVLLAFIASELLFDASFGALQQFVGAAIIVYVVFLLGLGVYLLLQTTHRYVHLSTVQGVCLGIVPIAHLLLVNTTSTPDIGGQLEAVFYALSYAIPVVGLGVAVFHYETFEATPAVGTIGERTIARETDDLVFVADRRERVIRLNETAVETLDLAREDSLGATLEALLGIGLGELRTRETVTLGATDGNRQYDPAVSAVTDQHGRELGAMVSLRDVTAREIRKQRLEVLNRVLRHNLRNEVSVIKANTEFVADRLESEELTGHLETTEESADSLAALGENARRIEELLASDRDRVETDLSAFLEDVRVWATDRWPDASVAADGVEGVTAEVDPAVLRFVVETLVENAIEHSDRPRPEVALRVAENAGGAHPIAVEVADDGPGIPDAEIEVLRKGTETPHDHGSGLGLWTAHWAVTDLGGELAFGDCDAGGSVVRIRLPSRIVRRPSEAPAE